MEVSAKTSGWGTDLSSYACADGVTVCVRMQATRREDAPEQPGAWTVRNGKLPREKGDWALAVSGAAFDRGVETLTACAARTVVFPGTLRRLGEGALGPQTRGVVAGACVEGLGGAFRGTNVASVRLPDDLQALEDGAFAGCGGLRRVGLGRGLERIGARCFAESGLERADIPASVVEIGDYAFQHCRRLTALGLLADGRLERVGANAFAGTELAEFVAPAGLRLIGGAAFCGCENLRRAELNEGLEDVGLLCFFGTRVRGLRIPDRVAKTPRDLGLRTDYTEVFVVPDGVEAFERDERAAGANIVAVPSGVRTLGPGALARYEGLKKLVFQEGSQLSGVGPDCFRGSGLEEFVAPPTLRVIAEGAFCECGSL